MYHLLSTTSSPHLILFLLACFIPTLSPLYENPFYTIDMCLSVLRYSGVVRVRFESADRAQSYPAGPGR